MPDDLVRKIRFDVTRWNLGRIEDLAKTIARREAGIREFLEMPETLWKQAASLRKSANELIEEADEDFHDDLETFREDLKKLRDGLESLQEDLRRQKTDSKALQTQLFEPLSNRSDVKTYLVHAAGDMRRKLTRENYWTERAGCDSLFSEYVELLRGVALRSARFGDGEPLHR